jgi:tetratricopeptide (TPR) repeat protein
VKRLLTLVLLLLLVQPAAGQGDTETIFAEANAAYAGGDYRAAIRLYTDLIQNGVNQDGAVFFNLGNAYYQSGDAGRAMVNYRRAQMFIPRDGDLNQNIGRVRAERVDLESDETGLLEGLAGVTTSILTAGELAWLVWSLWLIGFGLMSAAIVRPAWREVLRPVLIVVGLAAFIGIVLLTGRLAASRLRPPAVVVVKTVPVMSGPGTQYLELFELHAAAEVTVVDTRGEWTRFHLPDGREGWIPDAAMERV